MFKLEDYVEVKENYPLLNSFIPQNFYSSPISTKPENYNMFFNYFKRTPEIVSLVNAIITDILSDGYTIKGKSKKKIKRTKDFLKANSFDLILEEFLFDAFITGNAYLWKGGVTETDAVKVADSLSKEFSFNNKEEARKEILLSILGDETALGVKKLRVVPSSTMNIHSMDKYGNVIKYVQVVGSERQEFSEEEIIQFQLMKLNGKLYGFTPLSSIISEITLLAALKDYTGNFFANNGTPDMMFVLPKEISGSKNHQNLISTLKEFKKIKNKHGNMVFTGEIDIKEINKFNKDMEFRSLAEYLTKIIAMVWRVPPSIYGGSGDSAIDKGLSNQAYYRNIAHLQSKLEFILNTELFIDFGTELKFNKTYKEDEVREVQIEQIKTSIAEQRMRLGLWNKKASAEYLNIDEEDFGEEHYVKTGLQNQNLINNAQMLTDAPQQDINNSRTPNKLK